MAAAVWPAGSLRSTRGTEPSVWGVEFDIVGFV